MTLLLLALGFLPLGAGLVFEGFLLAYPPDRIPPFFLLGLLFLLLWGAVAFFATGWERQRLRVVGLPAGAACGRPDRPVPAHRLFPLRRRLSADGGGLPGGS